jgi:organic hydroperoxide reductase OsmC/OhrA
MHDLKIRLKNQAGELAHLGEALERAGVSIEGGGVFSSGSEAVAHFLFHDGEAARRALESAGLEVVEVREVLVQRLDQAKPGQLGRIARRMAEAGVNLELMYSDHDRQLILAVDDPDKGRAVSEEWTRSGRAPGPRRTHEYSVGLQWTGNTGAGTRGYRDYRREHLLSAPGKSPIAGSSDPAFRGDPGRWNPEELLVAALSACHQLAYLHLCAEAGVVVTAYEDRAEGTLREDGEGGGRLERVTLRPRVTVTPGVDPALARTLHARAHAVCFIARSVNFTVEVEPAIQVAS